MLFKNPTLRIVILNWFLHQYHLRNCRQLLNTVTLVLTWRYNNCIFFLCICFLTSKPHRGIEWFLCNAIHKKYTLHRAIFYMDNSGKVWLIRTSFYTQQKYTHKFMHALPSLITHTKDWRWVTLLLSTYW